MPQTTFYIPIRRLGPNCLRLQVPQKFARENDVDVGDHAKWTLQSDGSVRLEFLRGEPMAMAEAS
jgi:hypothetical protein